MRQRSTSPTTGSSSPSSSRRRTIDRSRPRDRSSVSAPTPPTAQTAGLTSGRAGSRRFRKAGNYLALVPFLGYVGIFLILPTLVVAVGAFTTASGQFTLDNVSRLFADEVFVNAFVRSIQLAVATAIAGAILGAVLAWAVVRGDPNGVLRQLVIAASGVLAQFGGVMLAFAFLATFGFNGLATLFFRDILHVDLLTDASWLYSLAGLVVVYTYFQIPLMLIVFLPSLDGLRQEWYDASASLGGSLVVVLEERRRTDPGPGVPGLAAAAVHERVLRIRDGCRPHQPGKPDHHPADRRRHAERGRPRPGERRQGAGARDDRRGRRW